MIKLHLYVLLIVSFTCCQLLVGGDSDNLEPLAKRSLPSLGVGEGRTEGFNTVPTPPSPTVPIIKPEISEIHSSIKSLFDKYANKIQIISKTPNPNPQPLPKRRPISDVFCQFCQSLLTLKIPILSAIPNPNPNPNPQKTMYSRHHRLFIVDDDNWELIGRFYRCEHVACADSHGLAPVFFTDVQILTSTNENSQCSFQKKTLSHQYIFMNNSTEKPDTETHCQHCSDSLDAIFNDGDLSNSNKKNLNKHFVKGTPFFTKKEDCKLIIGGFTIICKDADNKTKRDYAQTKIFRAFRENFADGIFKSLVKTKSPSIIFASELGLKKEGDKWTYTIKDNIDPSSPLAQVSSPCFSTEYPNYGINLLPPQDNTHSLLQNFTKIDHSDHLPSLSTTETNLPYVSTKYPNSGIDHSDHLPSLSTTEMNLDLFYPLYQYLVSHEINSTHLPLLHSSCYNDPYNTWPSLTSGESTHSFNQASLPYVSTEYPNPEIGHSDDVLSFGFTASEIEYLSFITL